MTNFNPALNFNFAAAESARIAYAERGAEEVVAAQLRQAVDQQKFTVGATVTARYQYKVAEDGSLVPTQTQITTDTGDDRSATGKNGRRATRQNNFEREPSLSNLTNPKPQLAPSDEAALFAALVQEGAASPVIDDGFDAVAFARSQTTVAAEVVDGDGRPVQAEVIRGRGERKQLLSDYSRAQAAVAGLYARNGDALSTLEPLEQIAA